MLKVPKVTPTTKRLIDAHAEIIDGPPDERAYLHTVLCQTSLPYRPTEKRVWIRDQGAASLLIEAGSARHPSTGEWVELGLPHGERPRLILIHLGTEAVRTGSPTIDVGGSLTAFARSLGIDTNGPSIRAVQGPARASGRIHRPARRHHGRPRHADQHADRQRYRPVDAEGRRPARPVALDRHPERRILRPRCSSTPSRSIRAP